MSEYDYFLDRCIDEYYEDLEEYPEEQEWDGPYPEDAYGYEGY